MALLKYRNNRNNYNEDITYGQLIGKKISYRFIKCKVVIYNYFVLALIPYQI